VCYYPPFANESQIEGCWILERLVLFVFSLHRFGCKEDPTYCILITVFSPHGIGYGTGNWLTIRVPIPCYYHIIKTRDDVKTFRTFKITLQALAKKLSITTILYDSFITIDGKKYAYISCFGSHDWSIKGFQLWFMNNLQPKTSNWLDENNLFMHFFLAISCKRWAAKDGWTEHLHLSLMGLVITWGFHNCCIMMRLIIWTHMHNIFPLAA
jgi:hypothetical protein